MAMISVTYADALISCFDANSTTRSGGRSRHPPGDTDRSATTIGDPRGHPVPVTPNHPEYPSAHSCITPTAGGVIARFLGTQHIDFTVPA